MIRNSLRKYVTGFLLEAIADWTKLSDERLHGMKDTIRKKVDINKIDKSSALLAMKSAIDTILGERKYGVHSDYPDAVSRTSTLAQQRLDDYIKNRSKAKEVTPGTVVRSCFPIPCQDGHNVMVASN